jgi:hypothetical protein
MMEILLPRHHTPYIEMKKSNVQTKRLSYTYNKYLLPFDKRIIQFIASFQLLVGQVVGLPHVLVVGRTDVNVEGNVEVMT